jgi:hypothetical protein
VDDDPRDPLGRASPYRLAIVELDTDVVLGDHIHSLGVWRERFKRSGPVMHDGIGAPHTVDLHPWNDRDPHATRLLIDLVLPNGFGFRDDIEPGSVEVNVSAVDASDPRFMDSDAAGRSRLLGATLRALRLALERQGGVVIDPDGRQHHLSLDEWHEADPDSTWLLVGFGHQQRSTPIGMTGTRYDSAWHWRAMDALEDGEPPAPSRP